MHGRLTFFERKRMLSIALDHPCFDGRKPLLSKEEMAAALARGRQKSGQQVVAEIMAELGRSYTPVPRRRTLREALGDAFFVPAFRRTVILGALALLLALFMTMTAPGRALAEEARRIVVTFARGNLNFRNSYPVPADGSALDFSLVPPTVEEPEELAELTRFPILLSEDEQIHFEYDSWRGGLSVSSAYLTPDEKRYTLTQEFYASGTCWGTGFDAQAYAQIPSTIRYEGEITLYAGVSETGCFVTGFADAFTLTMMSSSMTLPELTACLERIYVWQAADAPAQEAGEALDFSLVPQRVGSPREMADICRFPILLSEDELTDFRYDNNTDVFLLVRSWYRTENGQTYKIRQNFYGPDTYWALTTEIDAAAEIPSRIRYDGPLTLYAGTSPDGVRILTGYADIFLLTVTSSDMTLPELTARMDRVYAWTPSAD